MAFEFTGIQVGLDVASSLSILLAVGTFLYNQKKKNELAKMQQIDASARAVAIERVQEAIDTLSHKFLHDIVGPFNKSSNIIGTGEEQLRKRLMARNELAGDLSSRLTAVRDAISGFVDEIYAKKYQVFPVLDTLGSGHLEIEVFKRNLVELTDAYNRINAALALIDEADRLVDFTLNHPYEGTDAAQRELLSRLAQSIAVDADYRGFLDRLIASEDRSDYWDDASPRQRELRLETAAVLTGIAYEEQWLLTTMTHVWAFEIVRAAVNDCKKFLISLASISYTLLCGEGTRGARETPSQTFDRYSKDEYFALESEVR